MLCSGRYAVAQRAGNCVAILFVLVDGFGNERCSFSWSCFLNTPSSLLPPRLGSPQCTQQVKDAVIPLAEEREVLSGHRGAWERQAPTAL